MGGFITSLLSVLVVVGEIFGRMTFLTPIVFGGERQEKKKKRTVMVGSLGEFDCVQ